MSVGKRFAEGGLWRAIWILPATERRFNAEAGCPAGTGVPSLVEILPMFQRVGGCGNGLGISRIQKCTEHIRGAPGRNWQFGGLRNILV
jgi:hypothetical protein